MRTFSRCWFLAFFAMVQDPSLVDIGRLEAFPNAFTRNRKLNFLSTLLTIIDVGRESTSLKLGRLCKHFGIKGDAVMAVSQQAFSKARAKISEAPIRVIFERQIENEYQGKMSRLPLRSGDGWSYLAIDGTKISLPNLPQLRERFFSTGAGASSPTALGSCLLDIGNRRIIDAMLLERLDERACAADHLKRYAQLRPGDEKSMFLLDRGYPSLELFRHFMALGYYYLMRCRAKFNVAIDALPAGCDEVITIKGTPVRVLKVVLSTGEVETLVTNDFERDGAEFMDLYSMRWDIEGAYAMLKTRIQLENFTGKTENSIRQDFWATILAATMILVLEEDVDEAIRKEREGKDNKWEYQMNVNKFVGIMKDDLIHAFTARSKLMLVHRMNKIVRRARRFVCPVKPGRKVERAKNKRKVAYHHNRKSNC
jgi:hypothetical protein